MLKALRAGDADLVVSSRCIKAGSAESFSRGRVHWHYRRRHGHHLELPHVEDHRVEGEVMADPDRCLL